LYGEGSKVWGSLLNGHSILSIFTDEDVAWLKKLHDKYYPYEKGGFSKPVVQAYETAEFERVIRLIEEYSPPIEMTCTGMFGGYGMMIYNEPSDPSLKPEFLLLFHEEHIPPPTRLARIGEDIEPWPEKHPGCGLTHAWDLFSKYTHIPSNVAKLKLYHLELPRESSYYDY
jgi:hypothetical protein